MIQLATGLALFGFSMALLVRSELGVMPWDVLHQGLARQLGGSMGRWVILVSVAVLLLWVPLRQRPGAGTVANAACVGLALDASLRFLPEVDAVPAQVALLVGGVVLNAVATAAYIGARLGPGPRDGLMTGLVARTGWSVRLVRTGIEVVVVAAGWLLGGTLGVGTVVYALAIGPLLHPLLPYLTVPGGPESDPPPGH
ncbi:MAG: YczE/YyaS/YitT family protein [Angustibacter sp.]